MRQIFRSILVAFLTLFATGGLTACGGLSNDSANNADNNGDVQVTPNIPNSSQTMADNPVVSSASNEPGGSGFIRQGLYTGYALKMPLPAGYKWHLTTQVNDTGDVYHTDTKNGYYSLDFDRLVQDANGSAVSVDTTSDGGVVDILAAAKGRVVKVTNDNCYRGGDFDHTCKVIIDHDGSGYFTEYLHFKAGSIIVAEGARVAQGDVLGKMGNTGATLGVTGVHLHFQVLYNGKSYSYTQELSGITLDGLPFTAYQDDGYYPSTNGFAYDRQAGANPRTCSNGLTRADSSTFVCNVQGAFNFYRHVYSDVLIKSIQRDVCLKAEVSLAGVKVYDVPEYCSSGITPGTGLYYNNTNYFTNAAGSGQVKYYARFNSPVGGYLPVPFATVSFKVLSNAPDSQPPPTITGPANWAIVSAASASLWWADSAPWQVDDHDLYFWSWNGNSWQPLGWILAWKGQSALLGVTNGLPAYKWISWMVRSCGPAGCSGWSPYGYFALSP